MAQLSKTSALPGTCTLHRNTFITINEGTYKTSSLSLIRNEKRSELHLTLLILSSEIGDENRLIQKLSLVYTEATAELLKKWSFHNIRFLQENADN